MKLSEHDVRQLGEFARSAAKARSMDAVVDRAFRTLKKLDAIEAMRVVYLFDQSVWHEWRTSGKSMSVAKNEEWSAPMKKGFTVFFDPDNKETGYMTVSPRSSILMAGLQAIAPGVWNGLLLQSALRRAQKASRSETELVRATLRARDEERRRIAQELHDDLGQCMASLKLSLKWASDLARGRTGMEDVVRELASSSDTVGAMLGKIRDLSHTLYPRILDTLGLFAAVKELTLQVDRCSGMKVVCTAKGRERSLDTEIGVALYRCCQESISNVLKHAAASRLAIEVRYAEKEVRLTVEDNGRGFNPRALYDSSGKMMSSGFWTIRQRMADLGGAFSLSTARGQGTVVEMIVPYSVRENNARRQNKTADS